MDGKYEKAKSRTQNKQCDKLVGTQATRNQPKIHVNVAIRNGRKGAQKCPTNQVTRHDAVRRLAVKISPDDTAHDHRHALHVLVCMPKAKDNVARV